MYKYMYNIRRWLGWEGFKFLHVSLNQYITGFHSQPFIASLSSLPFKAGRYLVP